MTIFRMNFGTRLSVLHSTFNNVYSHIPQPVNDNVTNISESINGTTIKPSSCIVLQFPEQAPWNNPDNIVSFQAEDVMHVIALVILPPVLFLIACPANIINMIVFYKHGLKERINVCLFALSLADELCMRANTLMCSDQLYLRFTTKEKYGDVVIFFMENYLLGVHGFMYISQVLSAIIASERCFCVMYPLRSQSILRTSTMTVIIVLVHVVLVPLMTFENSRYKFTCAVEPLTGATRRIATASEFYLQHQKLIDLLDIFVLGLCLPSLVMTVVIVTTIITTAKLHQAAKWRASTSSASGVSERDFALTRMLVVNSVFFIICIIPFVAFRILCLLMPEVSIGGRQHNLYFLTQEILVTISHVNSTFNFIIYYTMGSRYRQTLQQLFRCSSRT